MARKFRVPMTLALGSGVLNATLQPPSPASAGLLDALVFAYSGFAQGPIAVAAANVGKETGAMIPEQ